MDQLLIWVYTALLIAGGLTGFLKAGGKASLIASVGFAIPLVLAATDLVPPLVADVCLVVLLIFFGKKYATGKQFMPGGLMALASVIVLIARLIV